MTSMITALTWVPRGHAAAFPTKYVFDQDEYARIAKLSKVELDDAKEALEEARRRMTESTLGSNEKPGADDADESEDEDSDDGVEVDGQRGRVDDSRREGETEDEHIARVYGLDNYDDEDGTQEGSGGGDAQQSIFGNIKSLAYHADNSEDPYITMPENEASDEDEREELQILPTDNLVLAARVEDEVAHLECYVYEDSEDNLYVHHDVMLPAVPLCVEWIGNTNVRNNAAEGVDEGSNGRVPEKGGNFAAIGTMDPEIEIWDLDVVDAMFPHAILGQSTKSQAPSSDGKKKKKRPKKPNDQYHVDAVLALASNRQHANLLASGSADQTVKLWDLTTCTAASNYTPHSDKVCALAWHPKQDTVLLTGSYDRTVAAIDARVPAAKEVPRWAVESDVEQIRCDPHNENLFYVSTEAGVLHCFDARSLPASPQASKAAWRLQAHDGALSSFALNPAVPGFIATGGQDRTVKLWNITETGPSLVTSRDLGVGKVFATGFAPDAEVAFRLAVAGSKGSLQVWDTSTNKAVREAFVGRAKMPNDRAERVVGVNEDGDDDDDDDEGTGGVEVHGADAGEGGWESMDED